MANKMADKKKTTSRSQMVEPGIGTVPKMPTAKAKSETRTNEKASTLKPRASEEAATLNATPKPREERKEQPKKERQESKSTRRDTKSSPNMLQRLRTGRAGRFMGEAYYELRHKVTWPTFIEARNMTFVVIVISVVIGAILGAVDFGLYNLFLLISGR